jgi:hypothetical protein
MIGAPSDNLGRAGKVTDRLLDKISELKAKRDDALAQIDAWEEASPELSDQLADLRFRLL